MKMVKTIQSPSPVREDTVTIPKFEYDIMKKVLQYHQKQLEMTRVYEVEKSISEKAHEDVYDEFLINHYADRLDEFLKEIKL